MQLSASFAGKHGKVRRAVLDVFLQRAHILDIQELCLCFGDVLGFRVTTETAEDETGLLVATDLGKPARGFGEDPDETEKDEEGDNLKGNGEAPAELASSAVDEGKAAVMCVSVGICARGRRP